MSAGGLRSVRGAAEYLDTSRSSVYELMKDGSLPFVRLGNQRRIRVADLDDFITHLAVKAGLETPTVLGVAR